MLTLSCQIERLPKPYSKFLYATPRNHQILSQPLDHPSLHHRRSINPNPPSKPSAASWAMPPPPMEGLREGGCTGGSKSRRSRALRLWRHRRSCGPKFTPHLPPPALPASTTGSSPSRSGGTGGETRGRGPRRWRVGVAGGRRPGSWVRPLCLRPIVKILLR
jgi:hypothetical protein